jgi:PAS domain S-box-containing protein
MRPPELRGSAKVKRNIPARKREQEALRRANAYNRSLLEANLDPLVTIGPDGKITDVNAATEAVTGCARATLIGTDFSDYFTDPEKARAGYQQVFHEGLVRDYPLELRHRDGHITSVLYNASIYRDESGNVAGVFAAARDITERKREQEALRQANAYNRSLLEASLDPLVTIGPDGKITDVNAATEAVTGCARATLIGTDFSDYFTDPEMARAGYQQVFREGLVRDYPLQLRHRDGYITSVLYNASIYRDENGKVVGVFAAARDITERERAQEALRQANAYNRSLLETSLDPLVTIGPDGKITDVNAATEAVTGCARATLIGTDFSDYFTDPEKARAGYRQVFHEGLVRDYPLELRHRDGRIRSVLYNASIYRDERGNVAGVFAAARDITERKRAEEALRQREQRLSSMLLEAVRDYAIIFLEVDGRVASWNKGAERIKGYRAEEIVGQHFSRFYTPDDIANGKPDRELQIATSEGRLEDEDWRVRKGGSRFWASVVLTALQDAGGKVNGYVKITRDLTARKQAEDEIKRYTEDLKRSNQELEHFAYVASHDLQEPLRTVAGFSQLLAQRYRGKLDADADEFITFVVEGATRMQNLINDLLAFSRIGTRGNPFAPVDCEEILQIAKENLRFTIAESGVTITNDPLPALVADQTQLTQLFQNLFSNAIKFRRPEEAPCIHVSAVRLGGAWQFSVRDNGIGIAPQYFDRIFVIFQRLHGREEYSGTGIGLAICKKIVERHGGRMWVESEPGTGSTFHFTIPDQRRN